MESKKTTFEHKYKIGDSVWASGETLGHVRDLKSIWEVKILMVRYCENATKKAVFYDVNYFDGGWDNVAIQKPEGKLYATKQELLKMIEEL